MHINWDSHNTSADVLSLTYIKQLGLFETSLNVWLMQVAFFLDKGWATTAHQKKGWATTERVYKFVFDVLVDSVKLPKLYIPNSRSSTLNRFDISVLNVARF